MLPPSRRPACPPALALSSLAELAALSAGSTAAPVSLVQFAVPGVSKDVLKGPKLKMLSAGEFLAGYPLAVGEVLSSAEMPAFVSDRPFPRATKA